jgi:molybdopterin converting factor small subunit
VKVTARLYGAARVALRCRETELDLPEGANVAALVEELVRQLGSVAAEYLLDARGRGYGVAFAVNGEAASAAAILHKEDIVSLLPPTAGGAADHWLDPRSQAARRAGVTTPGHATWCWVFFEQPKVTGHTLQLRVTAGAL